MSIKDITAEEYNTIVHERKETCVVMFSKESCSVCKELAPMMEAVANEYANDDQVKFYHIDVQTPDGLALFKSLKLIGVPQSVFIKEGVQNEAVPGAINQTIIKKEINAMINPSKGFMGKLKGLFGK